MIEFKCKEIKFDNLFELLNEVDKRANNGNILKSQDNPSRLLFGCLDASEGEWLYIKIGRCKVVDGFIGLSDKQAEIIKKYILTVSGRHYLFDKNLSRQKVIALQDLNQRFAMVKELTVLPE